MAHPEHLQILQQGVAAWNAWRAANRSVEVDLTDADLAGADLSGIDLGGYRDTASRLTGANLSGANLQKARLCGANLDRANLFTANLSHADMQPLNPREDESIPCSLESANLKAANLQGADMRGIHLGGANLSHANLEGAHISHFISGRDCSDAACLVKTDLSHANLKKANLCSADLSDSVLDFADLTDAVLEGVDLTRANLVETNMAGARISGCRIYGISAWNLNLDKTIQKDLVISRAHEPLMTVDNLLVAQFIYMMINNKNIRDVLNTITSKGVLILGRFSDKARKEVLDGLREQLRQFDLLPMVFDFDRPTDKDYTETVQTLAGLSMFVIADLTNPKSTPLELEATVKQFKIPYVPIIDVSADPRPFAMLADLQKSFHWVLPTLGYRSKEQLLDKAVMKKYIIDPVNQKRAELKQDKSAEPEVMMITEIV